MILSAATIPDIATFVVAGILIMGGAFGVILSRNTVHSALCLVLTLCGVAVLFVEQEAHFLAAVQVIVYAGAIVILFLFVIMLLGVDRDETLSRDRLRPLVPLALISALSAGGLVLWLADWNWKTIGQQSMGGAASGDGSNIEKLASSIFTQYLLPFEATSALLIVAVVGAVVLTRRPSLTESTSQEDEEAGSFDSKNEVSAEAVEVNQ